MRLQEQQEQRRQNFEAEIIRVARGIIDKHNKTLSDAREAEARRIAEEKERVLAEERRRIRAAAVSIQIRGAVCTGRGSSSQFAAINGVFDPTDDFCGSIMPVYIHRNCTDIKLVYSSSGDSGGKGEMGEIRRGGCWEVIRNSLWGREGTALARLSCDPPTNPELCSSVWGILSDDGAAFEEQSLVKAHAYIAGIELVDRKHSMDAQQVSEISLYISRQFETVFFSYFMPPVRHHFFFITRQCDTTFCHHSSHLCHSRRCAMVYMRPVTACTAGCRYSVCLYREIVLL